MSKPQSCSAGSESDERFATRPIRMRDAAQPSKEQITAQVLLAMSDKVGSDTYGVSYALKINKGRAEKAAESILSLLASQPSPAATGETPAGVRVVPLTIEALTEDTSPCTVNQDGSVSRPHSSAGNADVRKALQAAYLELKQHEADYHYRTPKSVNSMIVDALATDEPQEAQEIERLRLALSFYADGRRYQGPNQRPIPDDPFAKPDAVYINDVTRDNGSIAARALSRPQR